MAGHRLPWDLGFIGEALNAPKGRRKGVGSESKEAVVGLRVAGHSLAGPTTKAGHSALGPTTYLHTIKPQRNTSSPPQHYSCNYRITHTLYYHNYNNGYYNKRMDA